MSRLINAFTKITTLILISFSVCLQAGVVISPTKVTLEDRERAEKIFLINNSNQMQTYRLSWLEYNANETGGYKKLTEDQKASFNSASPMIRFSPKQVTLKPNSKQVVKLAVRRPKGLEVGEYRSHLLLTALPPKRKVSENREDQATQMNVLLSYSLPVIVKHGTGISTASIDDVKLTHDKKNKNTEIKVTMSKEGLYSLNGNIIVYWQANNSSEEVIVARVHNFTFYHELTRIEQRFTWEGGLPMNGTLRVAYEGVNKNKGKVITESVDVFTPALFNSF